MRTLVSFFLLFLCLVVVARFTVAPPQAIHIQVNDLSRSLVLLDFESDNQLDNLSWHCGTIYSLAREHATDGDFSLKVEMYPGVEWPGFGTPITINLTPYSTLQLDIFNPGPEKLTLSYRIDDREDNPPYADRANGRLAIKPGINTITFDFDTLRTSGTKRPLHRDQINKLYLFFHRVPQKTVLYLDHLVAK